MSGAVHLDLISNRSYQFRDGGLTDATTARTVLTTSRNPTLTTSGKAQTPRGKIQVKLPALVTSVFVVAHLAPHSSYLNDC